MSKSKHSEAQIIAALKQVEAGRAVEDLAREHGCVQAHDLRLEGEVRRHGGERGAGGEAAPRRECATEEAGGGSKPRQGYAAIGDSKKLPGLVEKRAEVRRLVDEFRASERRVCGLMEIPRMSYRYRSRRD